MNRRHNRQETEAIIARLRADHSGPGLAHHDDRRISGRDRGRVRGAGRFCARRRGSSDWERSPIPSSPTRRPPGCPTTCRMRSRRSAKARLMSVQQPIAFAFNQRQVGPNPRRVDRRTGSRRQEHVAGPDLRRRSRRRRQHLGQEARTCSPATWSSVEIVGAHEHDLIAQLVDDFAAQKASSPTSAPAQAAVVAGDPR